MFLRDDYDSCYHCRCLLTQPDSEYLLASEGEFIGTYPQVVHSTSILTKTIGVVEIPRIIRSGSIEGG